MTLGVVTNPWFDWEGDRHPRTPYAETVIYEAHVKGLTATHPDVPENLRGTYAGLAHRSVIEHLQGLGVTAVEPDAGAPVRARRRAAAARPAQLLGLQHPRLLRAPRRVRRRVGPRRAGPGVQGDGQGACTTRASR
ncbi:hypothetical protein [Nocardioides convexus]|uniref:hypothetical protein n=1 Tax=Nocardioides convexus TaxID=2712224 RepID=UPI00241882A8|nr:hypothetical protein [Nocardioides convexus]